MNRVILFGRLGNDPEFKVTNNGTGLLKLRMATVEKIKRGAEWVEETEWHNVTMWGKRAEALSKHLKKGGKVLVEGKNRTSEFEDRDGKKRYSTEVVAEAIEFGGDKRSDAGAGEQRSNGSNRGGRR